MDINSLNIVDYILLAIFFFSILAGFGRGFVREVISLVTLIAAVVIAVMFSNPLALSFTSSAGVQSAVNSVSASAAQPISYVAIAICFALLFAGTILIGSMIGYFINMAFQFGMIGIGNRILGAAFGAARGFVFCAIMVFLFQLTPFSSHSYWQQSQMVAVMQPTVVWLGNIVSPSLAGLKDKFGSTMQDVNSKIQDMSHSIGR